MYLLEIWFYFVSIYFYSIQKEKLVLLYVGNLHSQDDFNKKKK